MENFTGGISESNKNSFINHVFSTTEESKTEIMNTVQYSTLGVLPVVVLNKIINRFIPEADPEKSSLEIVIEILVQLIIMFIGIIFIHRIITYLPTYSGFKYESLNLVNVVLAFLILILSIQTKIGIKVNILVERVIDLWNGNSDEDVRFRKNVRVVKTHHSPSQADFRNNSMTQNDVYPPAPTPVKMPVQGGGSGGGGGMMGGGGGGGGGGDYDGGPAPANGLLGGSFGSFF